MTDKNLGHATAYGYAKSKGYTGTEEEFAELMASYAEVAESAKGYAEQAEASATNAETSETNARTSAQTASAKASEASASASNAQTSASNAQASATSAGTSASSASASAQTASTKASEASDSATSASESASTAVSAKDDAVTAKESAETAKADAETAAEEAQESAQTVANKADKDGTYPDMTVGGVMSSDGSTDSTPYLYRVSGGGVEVGKIEADKIVGGTVAFNQQIRNGNFTNGDAWQKTSGIALSVSSNIGTLTTSEDGDKFVADTFTDRVPIGHKVLYWVEAKTNAIPSGDSFNVMAVFFYGWASTYKEMRAIDDNWHTYSGVVDIDAPIGQNARYVMMRLCCRKTVITNQYKNVQVYDLTQMFGSSVADYIYSLEQSSTGAGVAFFRKLFPKDYYEYNTGELMSVEGVSAHVMRDADDNIIGSYPLDSSLTLRGIPKLSDGLYFDGDTYEADGTVTRKYGVVDLGTLNWRSATDSTGQYFASTLSPTAKSKTGSELGNNICSKYPISASTNVYDGSLAISNQGTTLYVRDTSYTDAATFKSAMSGVMLVYELATPTTESAEPYDSIQKVSKYGTEEYVSTGIVPVGHVTKYPTDIVAKVDGLPSDFSTLIAPTESGFKATRAYSVNQFIIVNNQLYRVTSAIASGATITVGTNVTATTVADILTALLNA